MDRRKAAHPARRRSPIGRPHALHLQNAPNNSNPSSVFPPPHTLVAEGPQVGSGSLRLICLPQLLFFFLLLWKCFTYTYFTMAAEEKMLVLRQWQFPGHRQGHIVMFRGYQRGHPKPPWQGTSGADSKSLLQHREAESVSASGTDCS